MNFYSYFQICFSKWTLVKTYSVCRNLLSAGHINKRQSQTKLFKIPAAAGSSLTSRVWCGTPWMSHSLICTPEKAVKLLIGRFFFIFYFFAGIKTVDSSCYCSSVSRSSWSNISPTACREMKGSEMLPGEDEYKQRVTLMSGRWMCLPWGSTAASKTPHINFQLSVLSHNHSNLKVRVCLLLLFSFISLSDIFDPHHYFCTFLPSLI